MKNRSQKHQSLEIVLAISVAMSVAFSVLLISISYGVRQEIKDRLSLRGVEQSGLVDVNHINTVLALLTVIIIITMMAQTAGATFVLGLTSMRLRRTEIALRRQSGVMRIALLREFMYIILRACLLGGMTGECLGILFAELLKSVTVIPVQFTFISLGSAFPVTIVLSLIATLLPAWRAASMSPALLRKE